MDQARKPESDEVSDLVDEGTGQKTTDSVEGSADGVAGGSLSGAIKSGDVTSEGMSNDPGLNKKLHEAPAGAMDRGMRDQQNTSDAFPVVDQGTSYNSRNLHNRAVLETVVAIDSAETEGVNGDNRKLEARVNESELNKASMKSPKRPSEADKNSYVINIKSGSCREFSENVEGERICRICHLASGQPSDSAAASPTNSASNGDLIQLGCACKDELGIAHSHCAEAWFKLKGNRLCEICGETAKNVSGVADHGFMEEWNERTFVDNHSTSSTSSGMCCGCWRGQPFCNFLMACLVIAFVLPWFFRVNMF
ncbi:hypothetical protein QN277_020369 [Acacia crassicarpa]|uniref:RING-CH-type domain-containing protein n=1 Tax=Acacia crassicarpa TaxID=499986 RepID=A0AAE1MSL1_9FABA|nr:hypothetical protein QN277_020369 [Acacia crassicarpa]